MAPTSPSPAYDGIVRQPKRPDGWEPPGPEPAGPGDAADLWPGAGEDLCFLTGSWRIFQRQKGHRYSLDDLATAWYAITHTEDVPVATYADIGCGIGSVLQMVAWARQSARCVGVEAQDISVDLARRSLRYNGVADRVEVRHGDLRDLENLPEVGHFDLVTGTPPYIPVGDGVISDREQCGPCRFELRGGVEDYCLTAARILAPQGRFFVCHAATQLDRVQDAALAAELTILQRRDVVPRAGRDPLFSLYHMVHAARTPPNDDGSPLDVGPPLVVRDADGRRTDAYLAIRERMGMPPRRNK